MLEVFAEILNINFVLMIYKSMSINFVWQFVGFEPHNAGLLNFWDQLGRNKLFGMQIMHYLGKQVHLRFVRSKSLQKLFILIVFFDLVNSVLCMISILLDPCWLIIN